MTTAQAMNRSERTATGRRGRGRAAGVRWRMTRTLQFLQALALYRKSSHQTIAVQFERHASRNPSQAFLLYGDRRYTYAEANALINRHAHAYRTLGIVKGDVVALVMENRPEFLWHFFGLLKLGAVASLINTHCQAATAAHALSSCRPKRISIGSEVWPRLAPVRSQLEALTQSALDIDVDAEHPTAVDLPEFAARLAAASSENPLETRGQTLDDPAALIYTSGTTGMPKGAIIRHERLYRAGRLWASAVLRYEPDEIVYNCLPLYHSSSIILGAASVVSAGVTMALSRKFSVTHFWEDVRRYRASSFLYIGELCRYLVNADPSPRDGDHGLRAIGGNGLRADVWQAFQQRFAIPRIAEFYAATEGNCLTLNTSDVPGSCGTLLPGIAIVRWDEASQSPVRDAKGFLVRVKPGEAGLLLCKVTRGHRFDGYTDRQASERKIVRNAFKRGDAWFNSGDLLRRDAKRRLFFVDRLGDTFRWKGENVATCEVEEQLARWAPLQQASVYGVQVPGTEGRAGMATLVLRNGAPFDAADFRAHVCANLPGYAQPIFLRIAPRLETTGTLKVTKAELQKQGFDPNAIDDPLYVWRAERGEYVALGADMYASIRDGRLRC